MSQEFDKARDELFSQIHRCGVLKATPEQQQEWLADTAEYLGERFEGLTAEQVDELRMIGARFCAPVIHHGASNTALETDEVPDEDAAGAVTG